MTFRRQGFALQRGLLSKDTLAVLTAVSDRIHEQWTSENPLTPDAAGQVNCNKLTTATFFPPRLTDDRLAFFNALASPELYQFVETTIAQDLYFHGTQLFFDPLGGRKQPYWHRDIQYMGFDEARQKTLFVELVHLHVRIVTQPEQSFLLVPGSHARWDTNAEYDVRMERNGRRPSDDLETARAFDLVPGDVLVFSAHMLHRATYRRNPQRRTLDLLLGHPHPQVSALPTLDELPTVAQLQTLRRPRWFEAAHRLLSHANSAARSESAMVARLKG